MRSLTLILTLALFACDDGGDAADPDAGGGGAGGGTSDPDAATPDPDAGPMGPGEALFKMRHDDGNTFACNTCHAIDEPADDFRRPGHPLGDAANRATYKNGRIDSILDAVNTCRQEWMVAPAFEADDARWTALLGYLEGLAGDEAAEPLSFEIVAPPEDLSGGDPMQGQEVFNGSCAVCHGTDAEGTQKAPPLVGEFLTAELIGRRVRTSGTQDSPTYDGLTGGRMPFWSRDRLADDELRDIVAFVLANEPGEGPMVELPEDLERECDSTHPSIGQTGDFSNFSHGIGGTVTVVDDCTVRVDDFAFDGQGVNVQIYGGLDGDYRGGFSMSPDIRRQGGYEGETLFFQLAEDRTLDDLDGISVWCVPVGINFGDARFE